jgi:hypothetical protein
MTGIEIKRVVCEECGFVALRPVIAQRGDDAMQEHIEFRGKCLHQSEMTDAPKSADQCPSWKKALAKVGSANGLAPKPNHSGTAASSGDAILTPNG